MRSNKILERFIEKIRQLSNTFPSSENDRILFLRQIMLLLNAFFWERHPEPEKLNIPNDKHPSWKRHTDFLAIWDDYCENILNISFNDNQIDKLAKTYVDIFKNYGTATLKMPSNITSEEFVFLRLIHATSDFANSLPRIDEFLINKLKTAFNNKLPTPKILSNENSAATFISHLGGADRNVNERKRYIIESCEILQFKYDSSAFSIFEKNNGDANKIFKALNEFPGIKSKKANMLLRDFYEIGVWNYKNNIQSINIIADNRIMRAALRTGILKLSTHKPLNSLFDQYDFQYISLVRATEEAFRRVWERTRTYNNGLTIVSYPGKLDEFTFRLFDGKSGCCKPNVRSCETNKVPPKFYQWLKTTFNYHTSQPCPFSLVCLNENKRLNAPFAIQNNTWNKIFTNDGGGGGLSGV